MKYDIALDLGSNLILNWSVLHLSSLLSVNESRGIILIWKHTIHLWIFLFFFVANTEISFTTENNTEAVGRR